MKHPVENPEKQFVKIENLRSDDWKWKLVMHGEGDCSKMGEMQQIYVRGMERNN
jgi:hypothetical protein